MTTELKQVFQIDGKIFNTKAEAQAYLNAPKVREAMNKVTSNNNDLTEWLISNEDKVRETFASTTIRRVSKAEHKALAKALETVEAELKDNAAVAFLITHAEAIKSSFRHPSVKRVSPEEQQVLLRDNLKELADGNLDLAVWLIDNKDAVFSAYDAAKPKREVSQKAMDALKAYREKKAAEKAAAEGK